MAKVQLTGQQRVGPYTLLQHLGGAGGGQVWIARADNGDQVALKVLTKTNSGPLGRFKDEIAAVEANKGVPGILPIIEEHVPAQSTEADLAWFSMPLATRIDHALDGKSPIVIGEAVLEVGRTMATLHSKDYTHRDIKPPNLVWWNDRACVIDFGLVSFEGKDDVTEPNSPLGPRWTMAPEMRRDPSVADGKPADVYSLAKTLWILLAGEQKGFDGQYVAASGIGINRFRPDLYTVGLDALLTEATDNDPSKRPSMQQFCDLLSRWIDELKDWELRCAAQWAHLPTEMFPRAIPSRAEWTDIRAIAAVLNAFGSTQSLNHMFLPTGGGMDMSSASLGVEPGTLELGVEDNDLRLRYVIRPTRLLFEAVGADPQWTYLRVETEGLAMVGAKTDETDMSEEVVELRPGKYAPRSAWDEGEFQGQPLPKSARLLIRFRKGSFVLFQKNGIYNQVISKYLAEHDKVSADGFRAAVVEYARDHPRPLGRPSVRSTIKQPKRTPG